MDPTRPPRARRSTRPLHGLASNTGPLATAAWLVARDLFPDHHRWFVEIILIAPSALADTELRIEIYAEEWGFHLRHAGRDSWIRVTDVPFIHGRDDHGLLAITPPLHAIDSLVHALEQRFAVRFARDAAAIRTSIAAAEPVIRAWLAEL